MIQKIQQTEKSSAVSLANTAVSSEMNSQISVSKDTSKSHFIKRKQSHCNVKRSCGVSYVKKTESKQANVRDRGYEKLPPIVIQGSYTMPKVYDEDLEEQVRAVLDNLLLQGSESTMLVISAFESFNEVEMKSYLLKPHKRAKLA